MNKNKNRPHSMNPCSENSLALEFYECLAGKNGEVEGFRCKLCSKKLNGLRKSNLVSHLKCMHDTVYTTKIKKNVDNTLQMKLERLKLLQNCVELTTVNKQPFANILSSGFQKIVGDKLKELEKGGCGINLKDVRLNPVKDHIRRTAARIREIIGSEMKDRMFSTSADIVTKNNRSIFGLYAQYMLKRELKTRCIGMKQLHDRHTGKYLCEIMEKCVEEYGVTSNQIISLTTDNGSNMKTLLTSINNNIQDEMNANDSNHQILSDEDFDVDARCSFARTTTSNEIDDVDETDQIEITNLMSRLVPNESDWSFCNHMGNMDLSSMNSLVLVNGVNCAAHTIQLAIKNALCKLGSQQVNTIDLCREVCKFIRQQSTIYAMERKGIKPRFPALDVDTR